MRIAFVGLAIALLALAACGPKLFQPEEHVALVELSHNMESLDLDLGQGKKLESLTAYVFFKGNNDAAHASVGSAMTQAVKEALKQQGYNIAEQPSTATCIVLVDVPYFGHILSTDIERATGASYDSALPMTIEGAKGSKHERIVLIADIYVALRTPQKSVRRHAPVVTTASHKSLLIEDSVRLASMTTEGGFLLADVQSSLVTRLAQEFAREMPQL